MELRINNYVRTDKGQIGKIIYFEGDMVRVDCDKFITYKSNHNEIIKPSPNIIDLIEVGDYVNGNKIIKISNDHCGRTVLVWGFDNGDFQCAFAIYEDEIKSIVAKEQFESMEYKLGE